MFEIRPATAADVPAAIAAMGEAFAADPLMAWLFASDPRGVRAATMQFFSILLRTRLALAMPALVLQQDGAVLGLAMGYDTTRPVRPPALVVEWNALLAAIPGLATRLAAYGALADSVEPAEPHYYLGVLGLHPALQGQGAGKALLNAYCALSDADPASHGVFLETGSESSLRFYLRNGFELSGEGYLGGAHLWCVYRPGVRG